MNTTLTCLGKLLCRCRRGVVAIEFGLVITFLVLLSLGGIEVARYILLNQKLEKTSFSMADLVAQSRGISAGELDMIFTAVDDMMTPFAFDAEGVVIITSVGNHDGNGVRVNWQRAGSGTLSAASKIGTPGQAVTLPDTITLNDKDDVIIAEVFYDFTPLIMGDVVGSGTLYKRAYYKPRLGELDTLM